MAFLTPEMSLFVLELLTALALFLLWLSDRQRPYTLWWALAFVMMALPSVLAAPSRTVATDPLFMLTTFVIAARPVCLLAGVISYRSGRLNMTQALGAIVAWGLTSYLPTLWIGRDWIRFVAPLTMMAALVASALMLWSQGHFERIAASFLLLRGSFELALLVLLATGNSGSPWFNHVASFNGLTAIGIALALLIAAYQRSLERMRAQYRVLELTQDLTALLQGVTDERDLARRVLGTLARQLGREHAAFLIRTEQPMVFTPIATVGIRPEHEIHSDTITIPAAGLVNLALETRRVQFSTDLARDTRLSRDLRQHRWIVGLPSQVVIPIVHHSEALGVIVLHDPQPRALDDTETRMLESLGQVIGLSLANARNLRELAHRADHDALTGLGNRAALHEYLQEEIDRFPERRSAVLLFDLDHFKQVNDALGHAVGDQLLQALAARLQQHFAARPASIFRLGGDEFVILHRVDEQYDGLALARELADLIAQPLQISGLSLRTPASIGVAIAPEHGRNSHELLRCADVAMYHAKQQGCGTTLYERSIDAHKLEHLTLLSAVDDGLDRDQFELFYQPFINLDSGDIEGCEGLIRWRHPTLGLIGANEFIPLIEATDLIRAITRRVIDIAMRDAASWQQAGVDRRIAINLSARNILDPELPPYLLAAAERHGVAPDRIQLEITETILIKDPASAGAVMQRLADAGFTLALDDFGTGYSSLAYLARFPIHTLKIDRSFVRNMLDHSQSRTIVESTISLARGLGLRVTAEGVEQQAEADLLRRLGCDCAQGFLFSRPVPMKALPNQSPRRARLRVV
jgi:diguanylate cyclase (GGDEF)-like protein